MVLFKSPHPDLCYPTNVTLWEWIFETEEFARRHRDPKSSYGGYINAVTRESLNWAQVKEKAINLSTALINQYHFQPGEAITIFSTNTIWFPVAMWALLRAGGRLNGASPAYTVDEMVHALKTAKPKILMTLPSSLDTALAAAEQAGIPKSNVLLLEGLIEGFTSIQQLMEVGRQSKPYNCYSIPAGKTNKEVCGFLNFSSGTTGLPKAVMLSHHNVLAQCMQLEATTVPGPYKILAVMPLFHITGLVRFCNYPAYRDGISVMLPTFTMDAMLQAIVDFQIPELILVPPIIIRLARDPLVSKYDLKHVKRWSSGSAPISAEIIEMLRKRFPDTGFRQGYGATESTACISAHPITHYDYKYAATGGMLMPNTVAKIIDLETGKELGSGETGEILAKGPQIAMGYLDNPRATAETFDSDGYFHSGDVGNIDEQGLFHIEDRIKEMIKVKGLQVPPAELEDLLHGHPHVEDCAVVGIPDDYSGEKPKAYIVLKQGVAPSQSVGKQLLEYVKSKKVKYKWLAEIEFTDAVPKSSTGKLLRRVLKMKEKEERGRSRAVRVRDDAERARL